MDIHLLTRFFMWCSIINGSLLIMWTLIHISAPNLIYNLQSFWFPMRKETFDVVFYCFIGLFKFLFLFFNLIPFISLLIIG